MSFLPLGVFSQSLIFHALPAETKVLKLVEHRGSFDLSGLVRAEGNFFAISDKAQDQNIYQIKIDTLQHTWQIIQAISLGATSADRDLEAIDYCQGWFYLVDERSSQILRSHDSLSFAEIVPDWASIGLNPQALISDHVQQNGNAGFEGMALDCKNQILYLAKERGPRRIFRIDLERNTIQEPFAIALNAREDASCLAYEDLAQNPDYNGDISDLKFENGYLYILERFRCGILKMDATTGERIAFLSFHQVSYPQGERLYQEKDGKIPVFPMAEALLLTEDKIWVGMDNNGKAFNPRHPLLISSVADENDGSPIIMILPRPKNF
ncbi:MAG: hypothetical protein HC880_01335 [Bacteroidia bacterium]|nr:hypothetical protein [Bacteroidia bacterium]